MNIQKLFIIILILIVAGIVASAASFFIVPRLYPDPNVGVAVGAVSAAVAATFGLAVATAALWAFIWSEDVSHKALARIWRAKERLQDAIHAFGVVMNWELKRAKMGESSGELDVVKDPLLNQGMRNLEWALNEAMQSGLYRSLHAFARAKGAEDSEDNAASLMAVVQAQVNACLREQSTGVPNAVLASVELYDKLERLNKKTLEKYVKPRHGKLSEGELTFMRQLLAYQIKNRAQKVDEDTERANGE